MAEIIRLHKFMYCTSFRLKTMITMISTIADDQSNAIHVQTNQNIELAEMEISGQVQQPNHEELLF